jgi:hypothetical protein
MAVALEGRERELVQLVEAAFRRAEPEHRQFRLKAEEDYKLYRGFSEFKRDAATRSPRDADDVRFIEGPPQQVCTFDDAIAERVDPFDFLWDPLGDSMDNVEFVVHRLWRGPAAVKRNVDKGVWRSAENDPTCPWDLEDLLSSRARTQRSDVWDQRLTAEGYSTTGQRQDALHEVWEFHDGDQVITVLDGTYPVQAGPNPGGVALMPFQIYRPTVVGGRFVGISEIEPIKHLQYEINTLRSQRRDAATLSLMRTFAYNETAVDPDDRRAARPAGGRHAHPEQGAAAGEQRDRRAGLRVHRAQPAPHPRQPDGRGPGGARPDAPEHPRVADGQGRPA